jgi:hypothetical protein
MLDYATDANNDFYLAYLFRNKVEKYRFDGKLLWRADWPIDYAPVSWGAKFSMRDLNACSAGVAVDAKGRIWVVTLERKLRKDEIVETSTLMFGSRKDSTISLSRAAKGNTDLRTTEAYKLEIFDGDGILLGGIRLNHFVDGIRIFSDNLFLLDQLRGAAYYQYKIIEK